MRIITISILYILLFSISGKAQVPQLSEQSRAVMFTCEPGTELYAGFGHSALWISDPANGIDRLYNYGTFDFNTPNFYVKFIRGKLDYMLSVTTNNRFLNEYQHRGIGVSAQTLNLKIDETQNLFRLLEENLQPENRFYQYDFFYDNCATRIRDIVIEAATGEIDFNDTDTGYTFRQLLFPYLEHTPWTKFGINLILGLASDKRATPFDYMYLPEHMQHEFGKASISSEGKKHPLVIGERRLLESQHDFSYNILSDPALFFGALLLLVVLVTYREIRTGKYFKWLDITLNAIAVVAGLFLFFMWVGTDHVATNYNLNILWLLPAQVVFLFSFLVNKRNQSKWVWTAFAIIAVVAMAMHLWPQPAETSFMIITLIYAFRYLFNKRINTAHAK